MTPAEYAEMIEEQLGFDVGPLGAAQVLHCTPEQVADLQAAHQDYCERVRAILQLPPPAWVGSNEEEEAPVPAYTQALRASALQTRDEAYRKVVDDAFSGFNKTDWSKHYD